MIDNIMAVYISGDRFKFVGNVDLRSESSVLNFVKKYGNHDILGIHMEGITISEKPLDCVPQCDKDMLSKVLLGDFEL